MTKVVVHGGFEISAIRNLPSATLTGHVAQLWTPQSRRGVWTPADRSVGTTLA